MKDKFTALLVHNRNDAAGTLEPVLDVLSARAIRATNCREAEAILCQTPSPHVAVTDTTLPDGTWMDILDIAAKALTPVNVIVVSQFADVKLYLDALDYGAFDFVTQSFTVPEITHVLKCALTSASQRRFGDSVARAAGSSGRALHRSVFHSMEISDGSPSLCDEPRSEEPSARQRAKS